MTNFTPGAMLISRFAGQFPARALVLESRLQRWTSDAARAGIFIVFGMCDAFLVLMSHRKC